MPGGAGTLSISPVRQHAPREGHDNGPRGYQELLTIPLDLGARGFTVTVRQLGAGWCIDPDRRIFTGQTLRLNGKARSYVSALFQLATTAGPALDDLERKTKRESEEDEGESVSTRPVPAKRM